MDRRQRITTCVNLLALLRITKEPHLRNVIINQYLPTVRRVHKKRQPSGWHPAELLVS
jgi:hypothetical protein